MLLRSGKLGGLRREGGAFQVDFGHTGVATVDVPLLLTYDAGNQPAEVLAAGEA